MHSTFIDGTHYHHNGDFSGHLNFTIRVTDKSSVHLRDGQVLATSLRDGHVTVEMPFSHMVELVSRYLGSKAISKLEDEDDPETLIRRAIQALS